eukprot:gene32158-16691_t
MRCSGMHMHAGGKKKKARSRTLQYRALGRWTRVSKERLPSPSMFRQAASPSVLLPPTFKFEIVCRGYGPVRVDLDLTLAGETHFVTQEAQQRMPYILLVAGALSCSSIYQLFQTKDLSQHLVGSILLEPSNALPHALLTFAVVTSRWRWVGPAVLMRTILSFASLLSWMMTYPASPPGVLQRWDGFGASMGGWLASSCMCAAAHFTFNLRFKYGVVTALAWIVLAPGVAHHMPADVHAWPLIGAMVIVSLLQLYWELKARSLFKDVYYPTHEPPGVPAPVEEPRGSPVVGEPRGRDIVWEPRAGEILDLLQEGSCSTSQAAVLSQQASKSSLSAHFCEFFFGFADSAKKEQSSPGAQLALSPGTQLALSPGAQLEKKFIMYKMGKLSAVMLVLCSIQAVNQTMVFIKGGLGFLSLHAILVICCFTVPTYWTFYKGNYSVAEKLLFAWALWRKVFFHHIHCHGCVSFVTKQLLTIRPVRAVAEPLRFRWSVAENLFTLILNCILPDGWTLHWILLSHVLGLLVSVAIEMRARRMFMSLEKAQ